jgi:hypothetical protein
MKQPPVKVAPERVVMASAIKDLQGTTARCVSAMSRSKVASDDEREDVTDSLEKATAVMQEVLGRASLLREDVSLWKLDEIEMETKWQGQETEVGWIVEMASVMLGRMKQKGHITEKEYQTLYRFWGQVVVQHEALYRRWAAARKS